MTAEMWGGVAAVVAWVSAGAGSRPPAPGLEVIPVAEGVVALVRSTAPGLMLDANVVFIVGEHDVVAVDANLTETSAAASVAALTPNPVTVLVNTHRHADHTAGNGAYVRAFPGLEIIGHEAMREDLAAHGEETLRGWVEWATGMARDLPAILERGRGADGAPLPAEERESLEGDLAKARELLSDAPRLRVVLPTRTVSDSLTLARGERSIELLHLGAGHTRGDLVVWLPGDGVAAVGDLVVSPVLVGDEGIRVYMDFLTAVVERTREARSQGKTEAEAVRGLDVGDFRARMTGGSPVLERLFDAWGPPPAVGALYRLRGGGGR